MINVKSNLVLVAVLYAFFVVSDLAAQQPATIKMEPVYNDFKAEFMWDAKVKIGNMVVVGESKRGTRRMIPITGGSFKGPNIQGEVLPGGEDWQLVRPDGDTELNARYLLKTNDGIIIQVINKALMHVPAKDEEGSFYIKSIVDLEAPTDSRYDYLNHAIFIGTLTMPKLNLGEEPYVIIGVYKLL
ncbi:DUF3237 domain-containing protein [Labilibaculum euxinus]